MARIRTVKPELFRHEELFELEKETGLPIRIAFTGLFTVADREGRFEWKPKVLKLDVLPHDEIDFSFVLNALATRGFLVRYASPSSEERKSYGYIPSFSRHQVINNKEQQSKLPDPSECIEIEPEISACPTRDERVTDAMTTPLLLSQGELEGKGREKERELESIGRAEEKTLPAKSGTGNLPGVKKSKYSDEHSEKAREFVGAYVKAYQTRFPGFRPEDLSDGATKGQIMNWIKDYPLDRAKQLIQVYFQLEAKWFSTKGYDFITFRSNLNKIGQALDSGKDPDGNTVDWASVHGGAT